MTVEERQQKILHLLKDREHLAVRDLAAKLYVSEASIRRDLQHLEQAGAVHRLYGAVRLARRERSVVPLMMRDHEHSAVKEQLARQAAQLVPDGATILLDASSTVRRMMKYLAGRKKLTIITNNERLFSEPVPDGATLYCTGGLFDRENHVFSGPAAERFLRNIWADFLFFSSQGVSQTGEISDHSAQETALRQIMLERAARRVCLMDGSKIGVQATFRLCNAETVTDFLCDQPLPWQTAL